MQGRIENVVIVGGGTAGWLSSAYLAAMRPGLAITLVESPDVRPLGVGEGTWPTMRETLAAIGISEAEFLESCDGSFKQGSRFDGWATGEPGDSYLHPFSPPPPASMERLLRAWSDGGTAQSFAAAMTPQAAVCEANLAPRQRAMPDYAGALNYAYHLDAGKFAELLRRHATGRLGVKHVSAKVTGARTHDDGHIAAIALAGGGEIAADFFIDCSGSAGLLIDEKGDGGWVDLSEVSPNDTALAVQVPTQPDSPIASQTIATAHQSGWIWDIALPSRRGIGCVYSSRFMDDDTARGVLLDYVATHVPGADPSSLTPRKLSFGAGHRERFWSGNCLAIGQSAGFIEPLEASAIVMVELSLRALAANFPADAATLPIHATRFNALFRYRWERIAEFLKLHYALSRRSEPYWQAQRDPESFPPRLGELLTLWRHQPPSKWDFPQVDEIFSAASQQYVLYGMGFPPPLTEQPSDAGSLLEDVGRAARKLVSALPSNRTYFGPGDAAGTHATSPTETRVS